MEPITDSDALIIVDVQRDFLPGGALPVPDGDAVVPILNRYIGLFERTGRPIVATRDWHPVDHCSFSTRGGPWPPHCIAGSDGAAFADGLRLPPDTIIVSKATAPDREAYSGFEGTELEATLLGHGVRRLWIGGLATDYCVRSTAGDALDRGFDVLLLADAMRAVDIEAGDGDRAVEKLTSLGARLVSWDACHGTPDLS